MSPVTLAAKFLAVAFFAFVLALMPAHWGFAQELFAPFRIGDRATLNVDFPIDEKIVVGKDWRDHKYAFNRQTMIEPYRQVGVRSQKWDEQAEQFRDDVAKFFAGIGEERCHVKLPPSGKELVELGCTDPLVQYCLARMSLEGDPSDATIGKAMQQIEDSYPQLVLRRYPANRCFAASFRLYEYFNEESSHTGKPRNKAKAKK